VDGRAAAGRKGGVKGIKRVGLGLLPSKSPPTSTPCLWCAPLPLRCFARSAGACRRAGRHVPLPPARGAGELAVRFATHRLLAAGARRASSIRASPCARPLSTRRRRAVRMGPGGSRRSHRHIPRR
jgi:hypothetical protein